MKRKQKTMTIKVCVIHIFLYDVWWEKHVEIIERSGIKSWFCHLTPGWSWTNQPYQALLSSSMKCSNKIHFCRITVHHHGNAYAKYVAKCLVQSRNQIIINYNYYYYSKIYGVLIAQWRLNHFNQIFLLLISLC